MNKYDNIRIIYGILAMVRRKVGGLVLDLTEVEGGCDIDALIAAAEGPKERAAPKEKPVRDMDYYLGLLNKMGQRVCEECGGGIYGHGKKWVGKSVCMSCHGVLRRGFSAEFQAYIDAVYSAGCTFCGRTDGRFHLDHVNMFSKEDSVCEMLDRGRSEADIRAEIEKCQLLCVPCHTIVTRYEQMAGFHADKRALNRLKRGGEAYLARRQELYAKYEEIMAVIYPRLRRMACGGL